MHAVRDLQRPFRLFIEAIQKQENYQQNWLVVLMRAKVFLGIVKLFDKRVA